MNRATLRAFLSSTVRLFVISNYANLLITMAVFLLPYLILCFLLAPSSIDGSIQSILRAVLIFCCFPMCLISITSMYRSVIRSEPVRLIQQYRLALGLIIEYVFTISMQIAIVTAPFLIVLFILKVGRIISISNSNFFLVLRYCASVITPYVFLFAVPLLVRYGTAYIENTKKSWALFKKHQRHLYWILPIILLPALVQTIEVLILVDDPIDIALFNVLIQALVIMGSVLIMGFYCYYEDKSDYA